MRILATERLELREATTADDAFILELLNDPDFLRNIGDRGVRTLEEARTYIENGPVASYAQHGFGMWVVELREGARPIGLCGLVKRDWLEDVDIGFAFLPQYRAHGYAYESANAVRGYGTGVLRLPRIAAIVAPHNADSIRLVEKLGLRFERMVRAPNEDSDIRMYLSAAGPAPA
jgi:[ribosomal protein S5]-alanine N-acetyltransferase